MAKTVTPRFFWTGFAGAALQQTMLAVEAQQVVAMRLAKVAQGGPDVRREVELMVSEKLETMARSGQMLMTAALAGTSHLAHEKVVRLYRRKVRANRKRLAKPG